MLNTKRSQYLFAIFVTIFMGHNMVLIKSLLFTVDSLVLTFIRMGLTALTLALFCYIKFGIPKPNREQWRYLLVISFFGVFIHQITLAMGLELSPATNGALIMGLNPLATTLFAAFLLKEPLHNRHYIGIFLGFIGIFFIVFKGFSTFSFSTGDLILFISMATQALSFIYTRKLSSTMPIVPITTYCYILGTFMLLIIPISQDMTSLWTFSGLIWIKVFLSSAVLTAFGFLGWNICLQRLGAGGASIFLNVITVTAVFGSVIYLGEQLLMQHVIGFLLISTGIWIATKAKKEKKSEGPSFENQGA